jgi:hypothetical protein
MRLMHRTTIGLAVLVLVTACSAVTVRPTPTPSTSARAPDPSASQVSAFNRLALLEAYGESVPDVFGGVFLDGGTPVVLFTDDEARHRAALADRHVDLAGVRFVRVQHTERELVLLQQRIGQDGFAIRGVQPVSVLVDIRENRVEVTIRSDVPEARMLLLDRWQVDDSVVWLEVQPRQTD